jgi:hypothetical protein
MKAELKNHIGLISELKNHFISNLTEDNSDLTAEYLFPKTSSWIKLQLSETDIPEAEQNAIHDYLINLFDEVLSNPKFTKTIVSLRYRKKEIMRLEAEQTSASADSIDMIAEIESRDRYINFEGINHLLTNNGSAVIPINTLTKWSSKGFFGEAHAESEVFPKTFTNHRTAYFKTDKVIDHLLNEKLIHPRYEILDQIREWTVLRYTVAKGNQLAYYCKDFESDKEIILVGEGEK